MDNPFFLYGSEVMYWIVTVWCMMDWAPATGQYEQHPLSHIHSGEAHSKLGASDRASFHRASSHRASSHLSLVALEEAQYSPLEQISLFFLHVLWFHMDLHYLLQSKSPCLHQLQLYQPLQFEGRFRDDHNKDHYFKSLTYWIFIPKKKKNCYLKLHVWALNDHMTIGITQKRKNQRWKNKN